MAPAYGAVSIGSMSYVSAYGRGRVLWPFLGGLARLLSAAGGGTLLVRLGFGITAVHSATAAGSFAYMAVSAVALQS